MGNGKIKIIALVMLCITTSAVERFEAVALVDHHDFAWVPDSEKPDSMQFDTETAAGCEKVLEHVLLTGADTVLWRPCSGAVARYQSTEEHYPWVQSPLDKRRLPENRPVQGWMRYYEAEPDILGYMMPMIRSKGASSGLHWPFEETHWMSWTFGAWNFEHPQYWGVTAKGQVWAGRCSLSYPEVVAHKLQLVDEMLERVIDNMLIDTWRNGGWGPKYEYVKPEIERWRARYGDEPPLDSKDPRWCAFVAETTHNWFVELRKRLDASGRKVRLMVGVQPVDRIGGKLDETLIRSGVDWERLVVEGVVDALVVMGVSWDDKYPFESTRKHYRAIMDFCGERCQVFFPVQAYNFTKLGIPAYQNATKLSADKIAENLIRIAWEEGADGVVMEVVDYNNYKPETRAAMRRLLEGECRFKQLSSGESE